MPVSHWLDAVVASKRYAAQYGSPVKMFYFISFSSRLSKALSAPVLLEKEKKGLSVTKVAMLLVV